MQPLTAFPLPLETGAPPAGYAPSDSSSTSAFEAGVNERDTFFGQRRCIICGKQVLVLQHCYIIPKTEEHTVSQISYTYHPFFKINSRHSGKTSSTVVGCLNRPKMHLNVNHAMASSCVYTIMHYLINTCFSYVSSLM
jgi:hypothetical protein